eukprot:6297496-Karenia_brevis.AAC.1
MESTAGWRRVAEVVYELVDLAEPTGRKLPLIVLGYREPSQTAMLVKPLRQALLLVQKWFIPIAIVRAEAA